MTDLQIVWLPVTVTGVYCSACAQCWVYGYVDFVALISEFFLHVVLCATTIFEDDVTIRFLVMFIFGLATELKSL